jgi:hypothetical protein
LIGGLPTDQILLARADYKSVSYLARVSFDSGGKAIVTIEVFESNSSLDGLTVENVRMAFQLTGDQLRALELYSFNNSTKPPKTYMNPAGNFKFSNLMKMPHQHMAGCHKEPRQLMVISM